MSGCASGTLLPLYFNADQKYQSQSSSGQVVAVMQAAKFGLVRIILQPAPPLWAVHGTMFQGPPSHHNFVIRSKGCHENIPAMVETLPASIVAAA